MTDPHSHGSGPQCESLGSQSGSPPSLGTTSPPTPGLKQIHWVPFIGKMRSFYFFYFFFKVHQWGEKIIFGCSRSLLWHSESLVVVYGILLPDQWSNPSPLCWEYVVLVTGTGKSQNEVILKSYKFGEHSLLLPGNFMPQHLNKNVTANALFEWIYKLLASIKHWRICFYVVVMIKVNLDNGLNQLRVVDRYSQFVTLEWKKSK